MNKPTLAVHKFSSCDGCQLALLNLGERLLELPQQVDITFFAEAGANDPLSPVDIALVEGSISTPDDQQRIRRIRQQSTCLVAIGACATTGGIQALRNLADTDAWMSAIYPQPQTIPVLQKSTAIADAVKVDIELHGCPVNSGQIIRLLHNLLSGIKPLDEDRAVCMECKRKQITCIMVSQNQPCMGPVTRAGCGALCPDTGRGCYGCYGPLPENNALALSRKFASDPQDTIRKLRFIHSGSKAFSTTIQDLQDQHD